MQHLRRSAHDKIAHFAEVDVVHLLILAVVCARPDLFEFGEAEEGELTRGSADGEQLAVFREGGDFLCGCQAR